MQPGNRPTLHDVAREAGLSVTQTSRALNGHGDVATGTRQRVTEVARRLGYSPNLEARRLKMPDSHSHSLGLILVPGSQRFSDPFFGELLTALVDEAAANGFELQLSSPLADEDPIASYERTVRANRVDGFIVLRTTRGDPRVRYLNNLRLPFVTFGRIDEGGHHSAVNESIDCLKPAIDHLVALGHRQIGCLAEPLEFAISAQRHQSFHHSMQTNDLEADPNHIIVTGFREDAGIEAAGHLLDGPNPPTAMVAFNDLLAIGAMQAAAVRSITVPGQLSIIGYDDIYAARFTSPRLTTLRHPAQAIGRKLIAQLLIAIGGAGAAGDEFLTPELIVRDSTAPASEHRS